RPLIWIRRGPKLPLVAPPILFNCEVSTPKVARFWKLSVGLLKVKWLNTLMKSAEKVNLTFSVTFVSLPTDQSRFHRPRPRSAPLPCRVSCESRMLRKLLKTSSGLAKRLSPDPRVGEAGLAFVPIPFEPLTPECGRGSKVELLSGMRPAVGPKT